MTNLPVAYEGKEPYIFISYAHKNADRVMPIISELQNRGFRVWYDAGIEAGTEWPEYIAEHLVGCGCFVAMLTKEALESHNCRREIHFAISKKMPMLVVHLEDLELTAGMEMQLGVLQAIFYNRHPSADSFMDKLCEASMLESCRKAQESDAKAELIYLKGLRAMNEYRCQEGAELYRQAAELGYVDAILALGECYERGSGMPRNPEKAFVWYQKAADLGSAHGAFKVAECMDNGTGTPKDQLGAVAMYRLAAEGGDKEAQFRMGEFYRYGERGLPESKGEAIRWYWMAYDQGHTGARWALQEML